MDEFQRTNPLARGDENIKPLDVYAEHAEIRKQVYDEIRKLHITLNSKSCHTYRITIEKFLNCIAPLKNLHDPGRLPVYRTIPRTPICGKVSCVWAVVSCLVQAYWEYESDDSNISAVRILLNKLKEINEHYPEMKIVGAENRGYWLEYEK